MSTSSPASTSRSSALTGTMAPVASTTALVSAQQGTSASTVSRPQVTSGASLQSLVQGAVQSAMDGILSAIDNRISTALRQPPLTQPTQPIQQPAATSQSQGTTSISNAVVSSATGIGVIPPAASLAGIMQIQPQQAPLGITQTTASGHLAVDATRPEGQLTPTTPLSQLVTPPLPTSTANAVKLAERIWRREFIDMHELSPTRLGASEPTLYDLLSQEKAKKQKHINNIDEWVICFNTYISVVALREPQRVPDLLAYSSLIVQASRDYAGTPWQAYDTHFRKQAAATKLIKWGEKDPSLWLSYFAPALAKQRCEECGSFDHDKKDCELAQESQGTKTQATRKGTQISQCAARFAPYPSKTPPHL